MDHQQTKHSRYRMLLLVEFASQPEVVNVLLLLLVKSRVCEDQCNLANRI